MSLLSRITVGLGIFLIVVGLVFWRVADDLDGLTLMVTVAGGALLVGVYLARGVRRARVVLAKQPERTVADEPHVEPTIWPLVLALSVIGLVVGAVAARWALIGGAVVFVVACAGWLLDVRRQWRHHTDRSGEPG